MTYLGKSYARTHVPDAHLEEHWFDATSMDYVVEGTEPGENEESDIGRGKTPMEAWHDAALNIRRIMQQKGSHD
jgi:hypothetical protein